MFLEEFMLLHHFPFKGFPLRLGQQGQQSLQSFPHCGVRHDYVLAVEGTQCLFMVSVLVGATRKESGQSGRGARAGRRGRFWCGWLLGLVRGWRWVRADICGCCIWRGDCVHGELPLVRDVDNFHYIINHHHHPTVMLYPWHIIWPNVTALRNVTLLSTNGSVEEGG